MKNTANVRRTILCHGSFCRTTVHDYFIFLRLFECNPCFLLCRTAPDRVVGKSHVTLCAFFFILFFFFFVTKHFCLVSLCVITNLIMKRSGQSFRCVVRGYIMKKLKFREWIFDSVIKTAFFMRIAFFCAKS